MTRAPDPATTGIEASLFDKARWPTNPRQQRALKALLAGPVKREQLDRLSGSSNSPDVVLRLRRRMGFEIMMKRVPSIDRDGQACTTGLYWLSTSARVKVLKARDAEDVQA